VEAVKSVFKRMVLYKSKSRLKKIPEGFLKSVFVFIARFVLAHGSSSLFDLFDQVQSGVLFNFFEKEAMFIGNISIKDMYRRHVLAGFTKLIAEYQPLRSTQSMVIIAQGLVQSICPYGKKKTVRDDVDEGEPAEFQEENVSFERTSFQPLYSIENVKSDNLPKVDDYSFYVLQCIQEVVKNENQDFLNRVGENLTKDTQSYFGKLLEKYKISF
jgi:hypothetical protein